MRKKYHYHPACSSVESALQLDIKYKSSECIVSHILMWLAAVKQFDSLFVFAPQSIIFKDTNLTVPWDATQCFLVVLGEWSLYPEQGGSWPSRLVCISYQTTLRYFSGGRNLHSRHNFLKLRFQDFLLNSVTVKFSLFNTTFCPYNFCFNVLYVSPNEKPLFNYHDRNGDGLLRSVHWTFKCSFI